MQAGTCISFVAVVHCACKYPLGWKGHILSSFPERLGYAVSKPVSPESLRELRAGIKRDIAAGADSIAIDVDDVDVLDSPVIAALISILRDSRERGATVRLRATRAGILDTLRVTGLDQVFTIVSNDAAPAAPASAARAKRPKGRRAAGLVVGVLFAAAAILRGQPTAAGEFTPLDIVHNVAAQNAAMRTYRAAVSIEFALRSFPYVSQHLQGTSYYERPDNYEIVFDGVPSYAKGFDKLYTDIGDPSSWPARFNMTLLGQESVAGHSDVVVRLVQKVRGMIDHEDVRVDPAAWHIDEMEWHYYNGGTIAMTQEYENVGGFTVLAKQHATIRIPFVHAAAEAVYHDYQTNVAIDDSVFTRTKH
jgi:anti-sigma B factor antagonist